MSDIMTIEQLAETSAAELTDNDLLMTSVRNTNGSYTSKKMTLNALADYVNSKSPGISIPTKSYIGGPLIYDTDEGGVVLTKPADVTAWQNSDTNYLWDLVVGKFIVPASSGTPRREYGVVKSFTKTVNKDCLVWIKYGGTSDFGYWTWNQTTNWHDNRSFYLKIDGKNINPWFFRDTLGTDGYTFFLAAGQKIEIGMVDQSSTTAITVVRIVPIISGARFFIDTKTDQWTFGLDSDTTSNGGFTHAGSTASGATTFQYTARKSPTRLIVRSSSLFATDYQTPGSERLQINEEKVLGDGGEASCTAFNLRIGDTLKITDLPAATGVAFCAYPIIMD